MARRDTFWNAQGWKNQESVLGADAAGNAAWVYFDFDAFGRPRKMNPPDGSGHQVKLTYTGDRKVTREDKVSTTLAGDESYFGTTSTFDRQGRLVQIDQPTSAGDLKTTYSYDALGHLTRVGQGSSSAELQSRVFTYDGRGFLTSASLPEKGGLLSYQDYDPRGRAQRVLDAGSAGSLVYTFDKGERLTQVTEGSSPGRILKQWTYGTSGAALGKVVTAVRHNYFPAISNTATVTETYGYGGTMRLPVSRSTQMFISGANQERFDQAFAWNRDGTLANQGYPVCRGADCGAGGPVRTVPYNYAEGFLREIPGFTDPVATVAQPIAYAKTGLVIQRHHLNNVTDTIDPDASGIARWEALTVQTPTGALSTGTYAYDGAGNTKAIGSSDFVYDGASRVVNAQMGATQDYAFDQIGNITKVTTNGSPRNTPTSSATNRLTSGTYDARGNLELWNGQHYEFDRLNKTTRSCATWNGASCTTQDWLHVYTADDERIWQFSLNPGGSIWTIRGLDRKVLRRYESEWASYTDSIWANGALFASINQSNVTTHWHSDELGNPRLGTDAAGAVTYQFHPFPFGEEISAVGASQVLKFTGHERDLLGTPGAADDRDYMHQRSYGPLFARFLSVDPIGGDISNPQSWNRYAYALGNPMSFTDPLGLDENSCATSDCITVTSGFGPGQSTVSGSPFTLGQLLAFNINSGPRLDSSITPWQLGWEWLTGLGA